jgi:hypothetical protein
MRRWCACVFLSAGGAWVANGLMAGLATMSCAGGTSDTPPPADPAVFVAPPCSSAAVAMDERIPGGFSAREGYESVFGTERRARLVLDRGIFQLLGVGGRAPSVGDVARINFVPAGNTATATRCPYQPNMVSLSLGGTVEVALSRGVTLRAPAQFSTAELGRGAFLTYAAAPGGRNVEVAFQAEGPLTRLILHTGEHHSFWEADCDAGLLSELQTSIERVVRAALASLDKRRLVCSHASGAATARTIEMVGPSFTVVSVGRPDCGGMTNRDQGTAPARISALWANPAAAGSFNVRATVTRIGGSSERLLSLAWGLSSEKHALPGQLASLSLCPNAEAASQFMAEVRIGTTTTVLAKLTWRQECHGPMIECKIDG